LAEPKSVSFDRAAGYYDRTRAVPDELLERIIAALLAELPRSGRCLEIGIGTGRIALPVAERGVRLVGVDISLEMLRRLVDNAGGSPPPVAQADATRLPFRNQTFASVVAVHVLHLIPAWRDAVAEVMRVLEPGGVIAVSGRPGRMREAGRAPSDPWDQRVYRRFFHEAGDPPWPPGLDGLPQLDEHMRGEGVEVRELPKFQSEASASINDVLNNLEQGYMAACWSLDQDTRRRAAARTREWASGQIGDLDEQRRALESAIWHVYRLRK
jgi:ubiquinone/menaquinone biosynthesis C-methylase UbiE